MNQKIRDAKLEACTNEFIEKTKELGYNGAKNWVKRQGYSGDFVADVLHSAVEKLKNSNLLSENYRSSPPSSRRK